MLLCRLIDGLVLTGAWHVRDQYMDQPQSPHKTTNIKKINIHTQSLKQCVTTRWIKPGRRRCSSTLPAPHGFHGGGETFFPQRQLCCLGTGWNDLTWPRCRCVGREMKPKRATTCVKHDFYVRWKFLARREICLSRTSESFLGGKNKGGVGQRKGIGRTFSTLRANQISPYRK